MHPGNEFLARRDDLVVDVRYSQLRHVEERQSVSVPGRSKRDVQGTKQSFIDGSYKFYQQKRKYTLLLNLSQVTIFKYGAPNNSDYLKQFVQQRGNMGECLKVNICK